MQDLESPDPSTDMTSYIGIDVSKNRLDIYAYPCGEISVVDNNKAGHKILNKWLRQFGRVFIVMEATGKYHRAVARACYANGHALSVVNPFRSHSFAQCMGQLAKTDKIDARMLAIYGQAARLEPMELAPKSLENLKELVAARRQIVARKTTLSHQMEECQLPFIRKRLKASLRQAERQVGEFDREIMAMIKDDPNLAERYAIITSVPGVGPVNAVTMIADMPELGACNDKEIAALVGVAPMVSQSGTIKGKGRIRGGRKMVRNALYMAAVSATRYNPTMKAFYGRLRDDGKLFKVAITAVMRKLIILVNALIGQNREWTSIAP